MTTFERKVLRIVQSTECQSKAYDLHFYPWRTEDVARVVMLRHRNPEPEEDDFTCHDAETGRNLGWGADKSEAESNARFKLSDMAMGASETPQKNLATH